jgi:hypothetical protein
LGNGRKLQKITVQQTVVIATANRLELFCRNCSYLDRLNYMSTIAGLTILPADEGNATVILNTVDNKQKITSLLEDPSHRRLARDLTDSTERKTTLLLKISTLTENICKQLRPVGSRPPKLYGLPKIHKEGFPLRKNVSNIGAPTYQLSKYLAGLLSQLTGNSAHKEKNPSQFVQILESLRVQPEDVMVNFHVVFLSTNVPILDSLELLSHHFEDDVLTFLKPYQQPHISVLMARSTNKLTG